MSQTPPKPRTYPLVSFGPEIFNALVEGSRREITISLPTYRLAIHFQQRIHMLRKALRESRHELSAVVQRARTSVVWGERAGQKAVEETSNSRGVRRPVDPETPCKVIIRPQDAQFAAAIKAAGVHVDEPGELNGLLDKPQTDAFEPRSRPDYLDQLFGEVESGPPAKKTP